VAGSYENEGGGGARMLVEAIQEIAKSASRHNRVELDVQRASGAFDLTFFDGMNNVYHDIQNVVVRVQGVGEAAGGGKRTALLINCHYDTVTDSPGASDDGAGCAVALETLRALAATPQPLHHPVLVLFNGAEENIMQGSHAFVAHHPWARSVRAFVNIEACGAGGREVLFQAGPHDPWIVEVYAATVPHPFASSVAQEMFESGLIPADTDFRIFRDFGNLSGVDLAWSSNGYVYHTALDDASAVSAAVLQRAGDNVLALVRGLVRADDEFCPARARARDRQPVYFDVLGVFVVSARAPLALSVAALTIALLVLKIHVNATLAARDLFVSRAEWWRAVGRAGARGAGGAAAGAAAGAALGAAPLLAGAPLAYYARPALLAPLCALPALGAAWAAELARGGRAGAGRLVRGWWAARARHDAAAAGAGLLLAAGAAAGARSAFLPLLWALPAAAADLAASGAGAGPRARALCWCAAAALPALQSCYLAAGSLATLVPIAGRAGSPPLPADVLIGLVTAVLALTVANWLLPFVLVVKHSRKIAWCMMAAGVAAAALATTMDPYTERRPQRLLVLDTLRTLHVPGREPVVQRYYWAPELDANTRRTLHARVSMADAAGAAWEERPTAEECAEWAYCGAPYYLPVLALVPRGHALPAAPRAPRAALLVRAAGARLRVAARGAAHAVAVVAPPAGARLRRGDGSRPLRAAPWGARDTYFFALHSARGEPLELELLIDGAPDFTGTQVSANAGVRFGCRWRRTRWRRRGRSASRGCRPARRPGSASPAGRSTYTSTG
ncbi:uncharacterized protein LOC131855090, partial [Achroia grisella]|uniref:uncharacterized protein LOC131855090 n=1 Tax=Achroia grisella TaxID=688607 RepID=UPI0027D3282E